MKYLISILSLLAFMMGASFYVGQDERVVYYWVLDDADTAGGEETCPHSTDTADATASGASNCFVPADRTLIIDEFSVIAGEAIATPEECLLVLETETDGSQTAGNEIASSKIWVGTGNPNAAGNCGAAAVVLDSRSEGCTRSIDTTDPAHTIEGGGWWRVSIQDDPTNDATCDGFNCTCTSLEAVVIYVIGHLQ